MQTGAQMSKGQRWLPFVFLLAVFLVLGTALAGPFQFDDHNVIVGYSPVHSLSAWWQSLPGLRPLLKLSYALNWQLSPEPFGFHLFNLLVHLGNGGLLFIWARRVLPLSRAMALLLMTLWLLHPAQTEAVTYIAGRSVSLSTTFLLLGLLVLTSSSPWARYGAALCTLLGLGVRETAWIFPLVFALAEYLRGRSPRECLQAVLPSLGVLVLAAAYFLLEPHYRRLLDGSFAIRDLGMQLRAQTVGLGYLLTQLVSLNPNIDPDLQVPTTWSLRLCLQAAAITSAFLAALYFTLTRRSWLAGGVLWFFLLLLPTNSFMPRLDVASDRHLYAALVGPLWLLCMALQAWRYRFVAATAVVIVLALATLIRNEDYRSELALWARTAQQSPQKARVWNNLGMACMQAGNIDCAREAFMRAMQLRHDDPQPALNLYFLQKKQGLRP